MRPKPLNKNNKPWHIRYMDRDVRDRIVAYAKKNNWSVAQALEVLARRLP
jgi:hypothetical protein